MTDPIVREIKLRKDYSFQYENFILSTQHDVYLILKKDEDSVSALRFGFTSFRYGSPNDEARGGHSLMKYGLGWYGLYQVDNSPWINELMVANRVHANHNDSMFSDRKHYVACFKDVMLEVVCREFEELQLTESNLIDIFRSQIGNLE